MTARRSVTAASATKRKAVASTCTTTVAIEISPPAGSGGEVAAERSVVTAAAQPGQQPKCQLPHPVFN
jgi:hypothetical protein